MIAWDQKSTENKLASPTDMRASSIFRIVESTQKSFHGPIVANDISMKFFSDWNQQQIPDNVTIVPILHSDKVIAMVLCIGDRSHYTRASLQFAERATQEFNGQIIPGSANAA